MLKSPLEAGKWTVFQVQKKFSKEIPEGVRRRGVRYFLCCTEDSKQDPSRTGRVDLYLELQGSKLQEVLLGMLQGNAGICL